MPPLAILVTLCGPSVADAANDTWAQTAAGTYNWNVNSNWTPNTGYPGQNHRRHCLSTANITGTQTINLATSVTAGTLNIGDSGATYYGYTLASTGG